MSGKKSHSDYENDLMSKEIDFVPLEQYSTSKTPILHECFNGHKVSITPTAVLQGTRCPECTKEDRHLGYIESLSSINNELECLETYIDSKTKILHKHKVCGYEWSIRPDGILYSGYNCPKCSKHASPKENHTYLEELRSIESIYTPIEEYITYGKPIKHKCPNGHVWKVSPAHILEGKGCPDCNRTGIYSHKYFEKHPEKANMPGILYLVALINRTTGIRECLKIGVTRGTSNKAIINRSRGFDGYEVRILKMYKDTLLRVFQREQELHNYWQSLSYSPEKKFPGHTECFEVSDEIIKCFPNTQVSS